jgi:hypothetical protein
VDFSTRQSDQLTSQKTVRWRHAAAILGDFLVVIGGRDSCQQARSDVAALDLRTGSALHAELDFGGLHSVGCAKVCLYLPNMQNAVPVLLAQSLLLFLLIKLSMYRLKHPFLVKIIGQDMVHYYF